METLPQTTGNGALPYDPEEEQSLDELVNKGVEAAAKGDNVEQILELMQIALPVQMREKARKAFIAALTKRGLKLPSKDADIPPRSTLARIRAALAVTTKQMIDRILILARLRPDVATRIQQAGRVLMRNGVVVDKVTLSEAELGTLSPSAGAALPSQDRGTGRAN